MHELVGVVVDDDELEVAVGVEVDQDADLDDRVRVVRDLDVGAERLPRGPHRLTVRAVVGVQDLGRHGRGRRREGEGGEEGGRRQRGAGATMDMTKVHVTTIRNGSPRAITRRSPDARLRP